MVKQTQSIWRKTDCWSRCFVGGWVGSCGSCGSMHSFVGGMVVPTTSRKSFQTTPASPGVPKAENIGCITVHARRVDKAHHGYQRMQTVVFFFLGGGSLGCTCGT